MLFDELSENLQNNYFTLEDLNDFSPAFKQILTKKTFNLYRRQDPTKFCAHLVVPSFIVKYK